jgi:hypothetical protein
MTKEREAWNWDSFLLDQVHKVRIETDDSLGDRVRCLTFYGDHWAKVLSTGDCVKDGEDAHSSYFELEDGWRLTGIRANTSYNHDNGIPASENNYWRNLQFRITKD